MSTSHAAEDKNAWNTSTFLDFVDGTLSDGGYNTYISRDGTIRLINQWDLNDDGHFDLPVSCPQDYAEAPDLYVYWADKEGFHPDRRTSLPAAGAVAGAAADLNDDGHLDLIVCNRFDGEKNNLDSYIYWGGSKGLNAENRSLLPTEAANAVAVGDLNADGYKDIVFANGGACYHMTVDRFQKSFIYWGSSTGYSPQRRSTLKTIHASDVAIADLNGDGHADIVFSNEGNCEPESGATVYYGSKAGVYDEDHSAKLPGIYSSGVEVADLNSDGNIDIVLANKHRLKGKLDPPCGDVIKTHAVNSYVYWGSKQGFAADRRTELPTVMASAAAVGDLNDDGLPDIVFANGYGYLMYGFNYNVSLVYWNSPEGFFSNKRTQIVTPSAQDCMVDDLDSDGKADLIFANYFKDGNLNIGSEIYWGAAKSLAARQRSELPTCGARGVVSGDFNGDGRKDLVYFNKLEGSIHPKATDYWIYWGNQQGVFDVKRRQGLPAVGADSYFTTDLNEDGHVDLIYPGVEETVVYWGSKQGFSVQNKSELAEVGGSPLCRLADFNRDGYLDIFSVGSEHGVQILYGQKNGFSKFNSFATGIICHCYPSFADVNGDGWIDLALPLGQKESVVIYYNGPTGFSEKRTCTLSLPTAYTETVKFADLNGDGHLDMVVTNSRKKTSPPAPHGKGLYDANPRSHAQIFWGSAHGYSAKRVDKLPTVGSDMNTIADLNGDKRLDIAVANYHGGDHRQVPVYIYWNSETGFDPANRAALPADSGCGIFSADVNVDGYRELIVANHTIVGDHRAYVSVYYGGSEPYSIKRCTKLPAYGPHYFMFSDIGNLYDRSDRYDYVSPPHDAGREVNVGRVLWQAETPFRTRVEMQIRVADTRDGLRSAVWTGPIGKGSYFVESGAKPQPTRSGRWLQYKASLISPNSANTPLLKSVTINYK